MRVSNTLISGKNKKNDEVVVFDIDNSGEKFVNKPGKLKGQKLSKFQKISKFKKLSKYKDLLKFYTNETGLSFLTSSPKKISNCL